MTSSFPVVAGGEPARPLKRVLGPKLLLLFIVGDILGTGVYALTGSVAAEVGGAAWLPFLIAFAVALLTAFSYLELVTKYPLAAGAALYTHRAFGLHFLTFMVAFAVMSSGITSAATASRAFALNFTAAFGMDSATALITVIAVAFMLLLAAVNLRGVGESVRINVVLTLVEVSGLLLVIVLGLYAILGGRADHLEQVVMFETADGKNAFLAVSAATSLAFFAMVGFEDSVNMAEETKDPVRIFPKIMLIGLGITGGIYVLVSFCAVALVPVGSLANGEVPPLVQVVEAAAPGLPFAQILPWISMFAVANSALINMLMASRLVYGMSRQGVLPRFLGRVSPRRRSPYAAVILTTALGVGLTTVVGALDADSVSTLGGTTALLLLAVFGLVNIAVLVLRRDRVAGKHFVAPSWAAGLGAVLCTWFVLPFSGRAAEQYLVALVLLGVGVLLWGLTWWFTRRRTPENAERESRTQTVPS
ncbi:APC family permease [Leucobacter massiliensis]|uniref:Amino acid permease n=1 Tax=Leucobacter massiliensis TaxID=1686285 RepID=A0A2S9QST2_9MICO|nr:APC family permease [Leucobacter massiliensis]PRI12647.1 amino acid permease [Leucobacter massiliensis]